MGEAGEYEYMREIGVREHILFPSARPSFRIKKVCGGIKCQMPRNYGGMTATAVKRHIEVNKRQENLLGRLLLPCVELFRQSLVHVSVDAL